MSLSKHSFSFQHNQNGQLILPILFRMVKIATMTVHVYSLQASSYCHCLFFLLIIIFYFLVVSILNHCFYFYCRFLYSYFYLIVIYKLQLSIYVFFFFNYCRQVLLFLSFNLFFFFSCIQWFLTSRFCIYVVLLSICRFSYVDIFYRVFFCCHL